MVSLSPLQKVASLRRKLLLFGMLSCIVLSVEASEANPVLDELALRDKLINGAGNLLVLGKDREALGDLRQAYSITISSNEPSFVKINIRARILKSEIDPLRRVGDMPSLKRTLMLFGQVAGIQAVPITSSFPKMKPTVQGFVVESKIYRNQLSDTWGLLPNAKAVINNALLMAAKGDYPNALAVLKKGTSDVEDNEFLWYYRAWIYEAQDRTEQSVDAFFKTLDEHTAIPSGRFYSIQVIAACQLSKFPERYLRL